MTGQSERIASVTCTGMQVRITGLTIDDPALVAAAMEQRPEALGIWVHRLIRLGAAASELEATATCLEHLLEHAAGALTGLHEAERLLRETDGHADHGQLQRLRAIRLSIHRELAVVHDGLGTATDHHLYR